MDELRGPEPPKPVRRVRADHLDRVERAWRARIAGATWKEAAALAGYKNGDDACRQVRRTFGVLPPLDRTQQRDLWRERLELLWRQAVKDSVEQRTGAVTAGVRVVSAAAALDGLNEPTQVDVSVQALTWDALPGSIEDNVR